MSGNFEVTRVTIEFSVPSASGSGSEKLELSFTKGNLPNSIFFNDTEARAAEPALNLTRPAGRPVREAIQALSQTQKDRPVSAAAGASDYLYFHDGYCDWWFLQ